MNLCCKHLVCAEIASFFQVCDGKDDCPSTESSLGGEDENGCDGGGDFHSSEESFLKNIVTGKTSQDITSLTKITFITR